MVAGRSGRESTPSGDARRSGRHAAVGEAVQGSRRRLTNRSSTRKTLPARTEELTQRLIAALHLAGDYPRSDQIANQFLQQFPDSALRVPVLFRLAENAYFVALAAEKRTDLPNRQAELAKLFDEAGKRYQTVIEKGGEFEKLSVARYGLAMCHFKKGDYDKARDSSGQDPERRSSRRIDLRSVSARRLHVATGAGHGQRSRRDAQGARTARTGREQPGWLHHRQSEGPRVARCHAQARHLSDAPGGTDRSPAQERAPIVQAARQTFAEAGAAISQGTASRARRRWRTPSAWRWPATRAARSTSCANSRKTRGRTRSSRRSRSWHMATLLARAEPGPARRRRTERSRQKHEPGLQKDPERVALLRYHHGIALQEAGKFAGSPTSTRHDQSTRCEQADHSRGDFALGAVPHRRRDAS